MNGPEHYREAEQDIALASRPGSDIEQATFFLARAQVHATLAAAIAPVEVARGLAVDWDPIIWVAGEEEYAEGDFVEAGHLGADEATYPGGC